MRKILVIGSTNIDMIATVDEFPRPGETIEGQSYMQAMGGKGANQAMAAHKLGGEVKFVTCTGNDTNSQTTLKYYEEMGLDTSSSFVKEGVPMGTALIMVNAEGENVIVIIPGANAELSPEYIDNIEEQIAASDIILLQMEIPYESVRRICQLAARHQVRVVLNVAPAYELDADLIREVDILVLNETEIEKVTGERLAAKGEEALMELLLDRGVTHVILTLGNQGSVLKSKDHFERIPAYQVRAVDTTAAGDTFCGALVVRFSEGDSLSQAVRYASAAAALSVTRIGAQPSIPSKDEVSELIAQQRLIQQNGTSNTYKMPGK